MASTASTPIVSKDPLARLAEEQQWISPGLEMALQQKVADTVQAVGGDPLRRFLHGDRLNEPLHAVLSDIPVGSWTATVAFDAMATLSSSSKLDSAADATLVLGLIGAVGAATTGMNDWSEIRSPAARRIGFVHGALNVLATGLFVGSCVARARRSRVSGRALAAIGYLLVSATAHLVGNLVYEHGIGVAAKPGAGEVTHNPAG